MPCCSICKKVDDNPVDFGEFMTKSDICVHYYCLLLSTHLPQNGLDNSGIMGFLLRDIRNEIRKSNERTCCYCKQSNASIACFKCKIYFHHVCANMNNCVSEFNDDFRSYCHDHVPFKREAFLKKSHSNCWICLETLGNYHPVRTLKANCCKNGYVHRYCMRKHALSAGYQLKCIWCPSKDFRDEIRKHGVFVPDREPLWDNNETLRYTDLHRGYSQCDATNCLSPKGREYFTATSWKLIICCVCGSSGVHEKCNHEKSKNKYTCEICHTIIMAAEQEKNTKVSKNNSMFIPKTFKEKPDMLQVINTCAPIDEEDSDSDGNKTAQKRMSGASIATTSNRPSEPRNELSMKDILSLDQSRKTKMRQLFLVAKNTDIIGTVTVPEDKIRKSSTGFVCSEEDVVDFSTSNDLIEAVFDEIESEGRELTTDMIEEVFERLKLWLETNELEEPEFSEQR